MAVIYDFKRTLTSGKGQIVVRDASYAGDDLYKITLGPASTDYRRVGGECSTDKTEAFTIADKLRNRKIAALRRQIARLEALTFLLVDESNV